MIEVSFVCLHLLPRSGNRERATEREREKGELNVNSLAAPEFPRAQRISQWFVSGDGCALPPRRWEPWIGSWEALMIGGRSSCQRERKAVRGKYTAHLECPRLCLPRALWGVGGSVWVGFCFCFFFLQSVNSARPLLSVSGQPLLAKFSSVRVRARAGSCLLSQSTWRGCASLREEDRAPGWAAAHSARWNWGRGGTAGASCIHRVRIPGWEVAEGYWFGMQTCRVKMRVQRGKTRH